MIGFLYENTFPERLNQFVSLDIGLISDPPLRSLMLILLYQFWFAIAYIISQAINFSLGSSNLNSSIFSFNFH